MTEGYTVDSFFLDLFYGYLVYIMIGCAFVLFITVAKAGRPWRSVLMCVSFIATAVVIFVKTPLSQGAFITSISVAILGPLITKLYALKSEKGQ